MKANTIHPIFLLILGILAFPFNATSFDWLESDSLSKSKKKPESEGYWGGISLNKVLMGQFQGDLEDYNASLGAPAHLGMKLDHVTESWRIELNPFEYRQRFIGEYIAFTTGLGIDWWHVGIDDERILYFNEEDERVMSNFIGSDTLTINSNSLDAVYLRVPFLVSLRTSRKGDKGLHVEAGLVGGVRIWSQYKTHYESGGTETEQTTSDFPINPIQLNARVALGLGNVSLLAEASLLPYFEEIRSPNLHSLSIGLQFAFNGR
ncbi:MAG: outer membrane beta-barrel protein [Flavobacteriales bacterium]|nr:outer membrane beta-barrel protein [Flavobacteriales bacterium]